MLMMWLALKTDVLMIIVVKSFFLLTMSNRSTEETTSISTHRLFIAKLILLFLLACFFCICSCQLILRQIYADKQRKTSSQHAPISTISTSWTSRSKFSSLTKQHWNLEKPNYLLSNASDVTVFLFFLLHLFAVNWSIQNTIDYLG